MKQFKITSQDFRLEGEDSTIPSCYVDPEALASVKSLAGIDQLGIMARHQAKLAASQTPPAIRIPALDITPRPNTLMSKNQEK